MQICSLSATHPNCDCALRVGALAFSIALLAFGVIASMRYFSIPRVVGYTLTPIGGALSIVAVAALCALKKESKVKELSSEKPDLGGRKPLVRRGRRRREPRIPLRPEPVKVDPLQPEYHLVHQLKMNPLGGLKGVIDAIVTLDFSDAEMAALPKELEQMTNIRTLDLSGNQLKEVTGSFLRRLTALDLSRNRGVTVDLTGCAQLVNLSLAGCALNSLPQGIADASDLMKLDLSHNHLLSTAFQGIAFSQLEEVNLRGNCLRGIPFGSLGTKVKRLDLSSNLLRGVSPDIDHLQELEVLDLRDNPALRDLPWEALANLTRLRTIHVEGTGIAKEDVESFLFNQMLRRNPDLQELIGEIEGDADAASTSPQAQPAEPPRPSLQDRIAKMTGIQDQVRFWLPRANWPSGWFKEINAESMTNDQFLMFRPVTIWLPRLRSCAEYRQVATQEAFIEAIGRLLKTALEDESFFKILAGIAIGDLTHCGDRAAASYLEVYAKWLLYNVRHQTFESGFDVVLAAARRGRLAEAVVKAISAARVEKAKETTLTAWQIVPNLHEALAIERCRALDIELQALTKDKLKRLAAFHPDVFKLKPEEWVKLFEQIDRGTFNSLSIEEKKQYIMASLRLQRFAQLFPNHIQTVDFAHIKRLASWEDRRPLDDEMKGILYRWRQLHEPQCRPEEIPVGEMAEQYLYAYVVATDALGLKLPVKSMLYPGIGAQPWLKPALREAVPKIASSPPAWLAMHYLEEETLSLIRKVPSIGDEGLSGAFLVMAIDELLVEVSTVLIDADLPVGEALSKALDVLKEETEDRNQAKWIEDHAKMGETEFRAMQKVVQSRYLRKLISLPRRDPVNYEEWRTTHLSPTRESIYQKLLDGLIGDRGRLDPAEALKQCKAKMAAL